MRRIELRLSLRECARRAGISHTTLRRIERDEEKPGMPTLLALASVLGVNFLVRCDGLIELVKM